MENPETPGAGIKLLRTAKGKRPQYFSDPAIDKLLAITVSLMSEVAVLRDRLDAAERLIEKHGLFAQKEINDFTPSAKEQQARDAWREQYLDRVFRVVQSEVDETTKERGVSLDQIIDDFTAEKF